MQVERVARRRSPRRATSSSTGSMPSSAHASSAVSRARTFGLVKHRWTSTLERLQRPPGGRATARAPRSVSSRSKSGSGRAGSASPCRRSQSCWAIRRRQRVAMPRGRRLLPRVDRRRRPVDRPAVGPRPRQAVAPAAAERRVAREVAARVGRRREQLLERRRRTSTRPSPGSRRSRRARAPTATTFEPCGGTRRAAAGSPSARAWPCPCSCAGPTRSPSTCRSATSRSGSAGRRAAGTARRPRRAGSGRRGARRSRGSRPAGRG